MIEAIERGARMHEMTVIWDEGSRDRLEIVIHGGGADGADLTVPLSRETPGYGSGLPFVERKALLCDSYERELAELTGGNLNMGTMDERQTTVAGFLQSAHRDLPGVLSHHHTSGQVGSKGIVLS